jgi:SWI/SNF-related matrix-associated actin-dependent regulator 1 of chromatin subfamily A
LNQQTPQNFPNTWPYNVIPNQQLGPIAPFTGPPPALTQFNVSPSRPTVTKKRKLVRGKSKRLDSDGDSFSESEEEEEVIIRDEIFDEKVLDFLNASTAEEISDISFTPVENVNVFCSHRPFGSLEEARLVELPPNEDDDTDTKQKKARGRRAVKKGRNIGNRIVDGAEEVLAGYSGVDDLISECEAIGKRVRDKLAKWTSSAKDSEDGALTLTSVSPSTPSTTTTDPSPAPSERDPDLIVGQPSSLPEDVALKDYQLIGVSWLHLLYKEGLSCILADEMGLGKTCQVIAFLGGLLERTGGQRGKHLVVVPSSTIGTVYVWGWWLIIENWLREFKRFCPSLVVEPYYGDQKTRAELRYSLENRKDEFHVIVTTYKLATGAKEDRMFLKKAFNFDVPLPNTLNDVNNRSVFSTKATCSRTA